MGSRITRERLASTEVLQALRSLVDPRKQPRTPLSRQLRLTFQALEPAQLHGLACWRCSTTSSRSTYNPSLSSRRKTSPAEFIGFAEDSGQISAIDLYMLTRPRECLDGPIGVNVTEGIEKPEQLEILKALGGWLWPGLPLCPTGAGDRSIGVS